MDEVRGGREHAAADPPPRTGAVVNDIETLADNATEGLRGDPELRLDVRQELISHLQETAEACRAEGHSDAESTAFAIKAFGPATDIAADLASANVTRMRLRGLARLAARMVLVPLSLAVAVWVVGDSYVTTRMVRAATSMAGEDERILVVHDDPDAGRDHRHRGHAGQSVSATPRSVLCAP